MSSNTPPSRDLKTQGIVLRRTNYGEADRILNIITPEGMMAVIAKGVRKPRSKLAGGVEMFTLSNIQIHQGRSSLGILTSAKMAQHYGNILKDYERLQLAGTALKKVSVLAEAASGREFFDITQQALAALDNGTNVALVETWLLLNLLKSSGEEINLHRDTSGAPLSADERYRWDIAEEAFAINENGDYGADEIKFLRLMTSASLSVVRRIKITPGLLDKALQIAKIAAKA